MESRILVWRGDKPAAGLSAAARRARHSLLAEAARGAGARVILMGHTADDIAEAEHMRLAGTNTPSPREWAPSPVWPEGREVFLLRPMLAARRAALRAFLAARGETWIEDPANADPASVRARARAALAQAPAPPSPEPAPIRAPDLRGMVEGPAGDLALPADDLVHARDPAALLGAAVVCVGGAGRPPRGERLGRLLERARSGEAFAATLAGARVERSDDKLRVTRDVADRRAGAPAALALPAGAPTVWDGRFEVACEDAGASVTHLAGHAAQLPPRARAAVLALSPAVRRATPILLRPGADPACPTLIPTPGATARSLVGSRLAAALGAIVCEEDARRMAKPLAPS